MIFLLVDVGNTAVKVGFMEQTESHHQLRGAYNITTDTTQSGDVLGLQIRHFAAHAGVDLGALPNALAGILVSSVVPGMDPVLRHACTRFLGVTPHFAHQDVPIPLENHYERPHEVGADRLVAAYAARCLLPDAPAVISVDFGTATTFDCVRGNAYLGGLICPGIMSSLGALSTRTAKLPRMALNVEDVTLAPGRSTSTSLSQGFLFGFAAMTEGLTAKLRETLPAPCPVVGTGGFAADVAKVAKPDCFALVRPDLLLDGLWLLAQEYFAGKTA